jgi:hypothetical protein
MIIIGYGSPDARAAIKHAGMLIRGYPALVLTVWGPPAPESLSESGMIRSPGQARAEGVAAGRRVPSPGNPIGLGAAA